MNNKKPFRLSTKPIPSSASQIMHTNLCKKTKQSVYHKGTTAQVNPVKQNLIKLNQNPNTLKGK